MGVTDEIMVEGMDDLRVDIFSLWESMSWVEILYIDM